MSIQFNCDGCNTDVSKPVIVGLVVQRHYCTTCGAKAKKFLAEEEKLRKKFYDNFHKARSKLLEKYENFKLPDM